MKHFTAMAIKFGASLLVLYVILGFANGMSFSNVFFTTLILSVVSYLLGDLLILPKTTNATASLADFGLSFALIWLITSNMTTASTFWLSFIAAIGITVFEYFFHQYLQYDGIGRTKVATTSVRSTRLQYQTEAAEEFAPVKPDVRSDEDLDNK
ncbi:YndM family protein [Mesobacillus maritimus]|uniref:YndM family protein n=1 Tax=Mesobacillus maritimus TaxID=1643336 RepID=UPI00203BA2FA|nr:YndM family protein [Mesobacillus maritimus]MCM3584307.1 YndM family protein [Mesobacillus maritimus]MCM3669276.1 YndM family protein [Mesobacillus maritimus]